LVRTRTFVVWGRQSRLLGQAEGIDRRTSAGSHAVPGNHGLHCSPNRSLLTTG
jgi:hypothetical protein